MRSGSLGDTDAIFFRPELPQEGLFGASAASRPLEEGPRYKLRSIFYILSESSFVDSWSTSAPVAYVKEQPLVYLFGAGVFKSSPSPVWFCSFLVQAIFLCSLWARAAIEVRFRFRVCLDFFVEVGPGVFDSVLLELMQVTRKHEALDFASWTLGDRGRSGGFPKADFLWEFQLEKNGVSALQAPWLDPGKFPMERRDEVAELLSPLFSSIEAIEGSTPSPCFQNIPLVIVVIAHAILPE